MIAQRIEQAKLQREAEQRQAEAAHHGAREGWATGVSIHADTGHAVAFAMNASNLLEVSRQLQRQHPGILLVIAGDDDRQTEAEGKGNPGVEAASKAAAVLGCAVVLSVFPPDVPLALSDFNDLANWRTAQ